MSIFGKLKLALALKRVGDAIEREERMGHDWQKTLKAAGVDFALTSAAVLAAYFADPANLAAVLGVVPEHLRLALVPLLSAGFVALRKRLKHGGSPADGGGTTITTSGSVSIPAGSALRVLSVLALLAVPASAQDASEPAPASREQVQIALHGGAMQFAERGQPDKRDFVYRLTVTVPAPSSLTIFGRADYTRTQDGGDLLDIKTFRSVEALVGVRRDVGSGFSVTAFSGATWNRDDVIQPADSRLWTAAAGIRYSVPGKGYVVAAAGHHGPVGGSAFLGSLVYEINAGASWFADVAIPLDASRFAARPYTIKAGISARLKAWKF